MLFPKTLKRFALKAALVPFLALFLTLTAAAAGPNGKPRLFVESVGVAYAPNVKPDLPSCEKDAKDIVAWADAQKGKLFDDVQHTLRLDATATKANVLLDLAVLKGKVRPGDYTILYMSAHGCKLPGGEFAFGAYDGQIRWSEIQDVLRDVPGTVIVILDACHSGGVKGDNLIVFSACLGEQTSVGYDSNKMNSLGTRLLLEALNGKADMNKDGVVTMTEAAAYVSNGLAEFNQGRPVDEQQTLTFTLPVNVPAALPLAVVSASAPAVVSTTSTSSPVTQTVVNLTGTWNGSENLGDGYGKLTFRFDANGKVVMIDAQSTVNGTYIMNGTQVTMVFPGVASYQGTVNGTNLSGHGKDDTRTWSFSVTMTK